jgi:hypothetical protein
MSLAQLQQQFQDYILHGAQDIIEHIEPGRLANHQRRLAIYYDGYRSRLVEALSADFEALAAVMGEEAFARACRAYVEATPSAFRNVRWYGGDLAAFLRDTQPWCGQPWLADIARFEWTLTLAFDAADAPHVRFEDLAILPGDAWATLGFRLHPSARTIDLRANAPAIRKAVDAGAPAPEPELADEALTWLVWRKDLSPHFRSLSEAEAWALRSAREGLNFSAICEGLCDWLAPEQAAGTAAGWLRTWVDDQLITALIRV